MKALYTLVGQHHRGAGKFVHHLAIGTPMFLVREPDNKHDSNAVQVWTLDADAWRHVGFVKGTEAAGLAPYIDAHGFRAINGGPPEIHKCIVGKWAMRGQIEVDEK